MSRMTNIIMGAIGSGLMIVFVVGLSRSISTGFADFWGGFPFAVIAVFVILLALYNFCEDAIRGKKD